MAILTLITRWNLLALRKPFSWVCLYQQRLFVSNWWVIYCDSRPWNRIFVVSMNKHKSYMSKGTGIILYLLKYWMKYYLGRPTILGEVFDKCCYLSLIALLSSWSSSFTHGESFVSITIEYGYTKIALTIDTWIVL